MGKPDLIEIEDGNVTVDAATVARLIGVAPGDVAQLLRNRQISSLCERGEGEDEGNLRLTFFFGAKRARILVGAGGEIKGRSVIDFGERQLPNALRRPEN